MKLIFGSYAETSFFIALWVNVDCSAFALHFCCVLSGGEGRCCWTEMYPSPFSGHSVSMGREGEREGEWEGERMSEWVREGERDSVTELTHYVFIILLQGLTRQFFYFKRIFMSSFKYVRAGRHQQTRMCEDPLLRVEARCISLLLCGNMRRGWEIHLQTGGFQTRTDCVTDFKQYYCIWSKSF